MIVESIMHRFIRWCIYHERGNYAKHDVEIRKLGKLESSRVLHHYSEFIAE